MIKYLIMKRITFSTFVVCFSFFTIIAQTRSNEISVMKRNLNVVQSKQEEIETNLNQLTTSSNDNTRDIQELRQHNETLYQVLDNLNNVCSKLKKTQAELLSINDSVQPMYNKELKRLTVSSNNNENDIQYLKQHNKALCQSIDSLKNVYDKLKETQATDRSAIDNKIQNTNNKVSSNQLVMENRSLYGGIIATAILFILLAVSFYLTRRIKKGVSSIDEVRKAQDALLVAQTKMQEDSVRLDNQMLALIEKQINTAPTTGPTGADHSLALKVADEIVRIEMNLSRMDASVKGYKQLLKAVQRIKDNFNANGYEIVDMLGKPYVAGLKAIVTFVTDETLEHGQQIITKIIKPQINYQQQMIQAAQIEVSQSE